MKVRTKEEMATYRRDLRARQKAQIVTPAVVTPVKCHTRPQSPRKPVTPKAAPIIQVDAQDSPQPEPCPNCARLEAELKKEREEAARLRSMLKTFIQADHQDAPKDDADALRARVVAAKVDRINNFGKGHGIGTARL